MPPERIGGTDYGARGKKHKLASLSMLEEVELLKKSENGTSVNPVSNMASDHQLCMDSRHQSSRFLCFC